MFKYLIPCYCLGHAYFAAGFSAIWPTFLGLVVTWISMTIVRSTFDVSVSGGPRRNQGSGSRGAKRY